MKMKILVSMLLVCLVVPAMTITANENPYFVTVVFKHQDIVERGTGKVLTRGRTETYQVQVTASSVSEAESKGRSLVSAQHRGTVVSVNAVRL